MNYNQEILNYIFWLFRSPRSFYRGLEHILKKSYGVLIHKVISENNYYPGYIQQIKKKYLPVKEALKWNPPEYLESFLSYDTNVGNEYKIRLARASAIFRCDELPWGLQFDDLEDAMALHRWGWLIESISQRKANFDFILKQEEIISDWIKNYGDKKDTLAWGTYTTSERLCNSLIFYLLTKRSPRDSVLVAWKSFAEHIIDNLEYYGRNINNHIINNARALYFAGSLLEVKQWSQVARLIFEKELPCLVSEEGFLREGSSHYQFLFTHWVLEMLWLARVKSDPDFLSMLNPWAKTLVKGCWFFMVWDEKQKKWELPLFGDVSPDFTPQWLKGVLTSAIAFSLGSPQHEKAEVDSKGWAALFKDMKEERADSLRNNNIEYDYINEKSGWYRVDFQDVTLFLRIESGKIAACSGHHGHNDAGSFCLYIKGSPVIIDPGRLNYTQDRLGQYGLSALAHNTILIDGHELSMSLHQRRFFCANYYKQNSGVMITNRGSECDLELKFFGFNRLIGKRVTFIRKFNLRSNIVKISDLLQGKGVSSIESRFHFNPDIKLKKLKSGSAFDISGQFGKGIFNIDTNFNSRIRLLKAEEEDLGGWFFPEYGKKLAATTLSIKARVKLPLVISNSFCWS